MKPVTPSIELEDSEEDLAESTPPDLDRGSGSVSESESDLPPIPTWKEPVATRSTVKVPRVSRSKQVTSKQPKGDKDGTSKKLKS